MDQLSEKIINRIQKDFPIKKRPFKILGEELGISDEEMIERVKQLKEEGYIRRIGGVFDSRKLGFVSTLCAMKVEGKKLEEVVEVVNAYPEVTHNYYREADYNVWFTLVASSQERINGILGEIYRKTGIEEIREMPAIQTFKIDVNLKI